MVFVLLWSTGFTVSKIALQYAEPIGLLSLRFALAAVILLTLLACFKGLRSQRVSALALAQSAIAGVLIQGVYLGGVFSSISLGIGAGLSALIVGLQPLLTVVLAAIWLQESLTLKKLSGIFLGLAGLALVIIERGNLDGVVSVPGIGLSVAALVGITAGSLYQKRYCTETPPVVGLSAQFVASALFLLPIAATFETFTFDWQWPLVAALTWLVLMLSVGAVFLLMWLIRQGEASRVAVLFYLVPPVVALQAWVLLDENISPLLIIGTLICIAGVALVMLEPQPAPRNTSGDED